MTTRGRGRGFVDSGLLSGLQGTDFMMTRGRGRGLAGDRGVSLAVGEDGLEVEESLASGSRRAAARVALGLLRRVENVSEGFCREEDGPLGRGSLRISISSDMGLNKSWESSRDDDGGGTSATVSPEGMFFLFFLNRSPFTASRDDGL